MILAALTLCGPTATVPATCDVHRLKHMPEEVHEPWCKVLAKCDATVGSALLATSVNCTTTNTVHAAWASYMKPETLKKFKELTAQYGGRGGTLGPMGPGALGLPGSAPPKSETEKMCGQPACMVAVEHLYEAATQDSEWLEAERMAKMFMNLGSFGGRRLEGTTTTATGANSVAANLAAHGGAPGSKFAHAMELSQTVRGIQNSAAIQLNWCMSEAGVKEADLGLPLSIDKMTGGGKFFDVATLNDQTCSTLTQWLTKRLSYYSGYDYAEQKYHEGTNVGLIIAIVIGSINLICICGCFVGTVVCIRNKTCYFCMKEMCPCCVDCLVGCGCGPEDAERLNNESVMRDSDIELQKHESTA